MLCLNFLAFLALGLPLVCLATPVEDCQTLSKSLPEKVFFNGSAQYVESITSYYYVQERLLPECVVKPKSAEDVSLILELVGKSGSPFAVRGGGHASQRGAANSEHGITIDMRSISAVDLESDGSVAAIGAGATWDQVYSVLDLRKLSVLGGRASHVGVGGLLLGGGISFFSPERGFACDYVVNFQVVLACGQITNANATFNKDLFVALKGGTNNFALVTRYDLKTFAQGQFWGGGIVYPELTFDQLVKATTEGKQAENYDPYTEFESSFVYLGATKQFLGATSLYYTRPVVNASSLLRFTTISPQLSNSMRLSNTTDFAREVFTLSTPNQLSVWATTTFAISPDIISQIIPIWKSSALAMNEVTKLISSMTLQSIPPPAPRDSPNSLGFPPSSSPQKDLILLLISNFFEDESAYSKIATLTKDFIGAVDGVANKENINRKYTYLNYAALWQRPLKDYGSDSYVFLVKTAKKYDTYGVFQNQTGGFKLFN